MTIDTPIKVESWYEYIWKHPKFTGCLIDKNNDIAWFKNGKIHRTDGPAFELINGSKEWWLNGKHHRTDGPAIERADGSNSWWLNGVLHRTDGPAIECANGDKEWWLNDEELSEQEHRKRVRHIKLKLLDSIQ